jgi:serine protease Do
MTLKQSFAVVMLSAAASVGSVWAFGKLQDHQSDLNFTSSPSIFRKANLTDGTVSTPMTDFEKAATKAAPAVVHIKTVIKSNQVGSVPDMESNPFKEFFGDQFGDMFPGNPRSMPQRASGSGVLVSADGYIVTNNHVVDQASELIVTLNNKKDYKAKVVGKDPSTDLAVLKIDVKGLPYLSFSSSDDVHLGQWVLAIGYPLNLETTVTSGIVSAKSRNIGINSRNSSTPIESFIQTDAAVNPGNSGGALVNTDGDLIGINSAIASPTGSYAGYSYAIPSNIVQKVVSDIVKYGSTKRAYLGVMFGSNQMTAEDKEKNNVKEGDGVFVMDVAKGSAAEEAGISKGDFITKLNGNPLNSGTEMIEKISAMRPGDKLNLTFNHNGTEKTVTVTLKGSAGNYASIKEQVVEQLGASFENLDESQARQLNLDGGVIVKQLSQGILTDQTKIRQGFIITRVNDTKVSTVDDLKAALRDSGNTAIISGVYPNRPEIEYQYALNDLGNN